MNIRFPLTSFKIGIFQIGLILAVLYIIAGYNYLLFHALAEFFGAAIGIAIFLLVWNARKYARNNFYLFLGTAFLTVGAIRIIHSLVYRGMGVILATAEDANLATQLWLVGQYILAGSMVAAPILLRNRLNATVILTSYLALFILSLFSIFYWHNFPAAYIEGSGLTDFKKNSEYLVAFLFIISIYLFWQRRHLLDKRVLKLITFINGLFFLSTISFTLYAGVYSFFNEVGHLFSILAFYGGYLAIVELGLMRPYNLLFQDVKRNEDRYRAIIEDQEEYICRFNPKNGILTFANNAYCNFFGKKADDMIGKSYWNLLPSGELDAEKERLAKLSAKNPILKTEHPAIDKDKNFRWQSWTTRGIFGEDGRIIECQSVGHDITDRKAAEDALRQREKQLKLSMEGSGGTMWSIEIDPMHPEKFPDKMYLSPELKKIIGYKDNEFPNSMSAWKDRILPEDRRQLEKAAADHLAGKRDFHEMDYRIRHRDGSIRWIYTKGQILRDERRKPIRFAGMDWDVTEQKQIRLTIAESERKYQSLFSKMISGFAYHKMLYDRNGRPCDYIFLEVNHAFEQLTGLRREKIIGRRATEVIPGIEKDPANWIGKYGRVATLAEEIKFEKYSAPLKKWFSVSAYSPQKDHFVTIFEDITLRKETEKILRDSRDEWMRTFDSLPDLIAIIDNNHRIVKANRAMAEKLGLESGEKCSGLFCYKAVHNRSKPIPKCPHSASLKDGKEHIEEIYEPRLGGYFLVSTTPLRDKKGDIIGCVHVARDITERKEAEKIMADLAKFPLENPNPVMRIAKDGTLLYANPAADVLMKAHKIKPDQKLPGLWKKPVQAAMKKNEKRIFEAEVGDKIYSILITPVVEEGYANLYAMDITDRRRAEKFLLYEKDKLSRILDNMEDGVYIATSDYHITYVNPTLRKYFGAVYERKKCFEYLYKRKTPCPWCLNKKVFLGKSVRNERHYKTLGKTFDVIETPMTNPEGTTVKLAIFRDITERKKTEDAKDEFVSLASHQLRTPLSNIGLSSELLLRGMSGKLDDGQKEYIEEINKATKRMSLLVNNLLNVSRIEMGTFKVKKESIDLIKVLNSSFSEYTALAYEKKLTLQKYSGEDIPLVSIDESSFRIVFDNFLSNAIRYTSSGGRILVEIFKKGKNVVLKVSDTGCGIPERHKNEIFKKSFQAENAKEINTDGAGLGLYIVKEIAVRTGSRVWFESRRGNGTNFFFSIPIKK